MHSLFFFFLKDTATTEISTLPLHDALPIAAQLDSDVAAADDCDALGLGGELEEAVRGDPELGSRNRRQAGMPAGGDHDVIGREHPPGRGDAARIDEAARTAQQLHLALREVRGVDLVEAQHVRVASLLQRSPVVPGDLEPEAVVRRIVERAAELGGVPAYFLRHAADVHAGAAEAAGLDERRPGAALGGPLRRGQPPASAPYHHYVEFLAHSPSAAHESPRATRWYPRTRLPRPLQWRLIQRR